MPRRAYIRAFVPPCVRCASLDVKRNGYGSDGAPVFQCRACLKKFKAPESGSGSGVIAGKITVGRGSVWGAGRV